MFDVSRKLHRGRLLAAATALFLATLASTASATPSKAPETHDVCAAAIDRAEAGRNLPHELMTAISRVESGRWDKARKELVAWPWTVTNGPDGQYFPTKEAAIAHVRALQARGISNIDVGCMQVNLHFHPDAFESLDAALDPETNARYAADLLGRLFESRRSWGEAIRHYHSATPKFNRPYHEKVVRQWNAARTVSAEAHRQAVIAAHKAQREKWRAEREAQLAAARIPAARR